MCGYDIYEYKYIYLLLLCLWQGVQQITWGDGRLYSQVNENLYYNSTQAWEQEYELTFSGYYLEELSYEWVNLANQLK